MHKPYILHAIGKQNNFIIENKPSLIRRVISEETSKIVANALESVVAKGTGRACYIDGYRIGGKTGTAQIAENGHYLSNKFILSFLAIAPMDDPKIGVYLAIQNPHNAIQYGGTTVGPLVKEIMSESLSFLNVKKNYEGISYQPRLWVDKPLYKIPEYIGMNKKDVKYNPYYNFIIEGTGNIIIGQMPEAGESIIEGGTVILYT